MTVLPSTFICGVVRNAAGTLPASLRVIERLRGVFCASMVCIVTNDNADGTDAVLREWIDVASGRTVVDLAGLVQVEPERTARIATARNAYLEALAQAGPENWALTLVLDLDGPNASLDTEGFVAAVTTLDRSWTALFANQYEAYYDLFALRHPLWCPTDYVVELEAVRVWPWNRRRRRRAAKRELVFGRQYRIAPSFGPIRVQSAFGGLGLYRTDALMRSRYRGRDGTARRICEHVALHAEMRRRTADLFILPALRNHAPLEHLGPGSGRPFPVHLADDWMP